MVGNNFCTVTVSHCCENISVSKACRYFLKSYRNINTQAERNTIDRFSQARDKLLVKTRAYGRMNYEI